MITLGGVGYHYLSRTDNFKRIWGHDFGLFKKHIDYFCQNYRIVAPNDIERNDYPPDSNNLIISFDDGLKESTIMADYLSECKIKGLFNIPSCLLRLEPANPQVWHFGMAHYGVRKFFIFAKEAIAKICPEKTGLLPHEPGKMETMELHKFIKNFFKRTLDYFASRKILLEIYKKHLLKDFPDFMDRVYLSADDIIDLSNQGHVIGSHTDTHCVVRDIIDNPALVEKELVESRKSLSNLINQEVNILTYPFGGAEDIVNDNKMLMQTGYNLAFTIFKESEEFNLFKIGRYCPSSLETINDLKEKIWSYEIKRD